MNRDEAANIARALGADRVVQVDQKYVGGPLDLLSLREEFERRLRSTGGRPTDPAWKVSRQVPFKEETWASLQGLADEVGRTGRRVGPAQVAALLVERSLSELEDLKWEEALNESRSLAPLSQPEAAVAAHVTYNQLDDWVKRGWIAPIGRRGRQRFFSADEVIRARWLSSALRATQVSETLVSGIRRADMSLRYLVVTDEDEVITAADRAELYRRLESPGGHLVIDQLPERRKLTGLPPEPPTGLSDQEKMRRVG